MPPQAAQRGIVPLRPLGMGEIFDGAFKALRFNPKVLLGMSALILAVSAVIAALLQLPNGSLLDTLTSWLNTDIYSPDYTGDLPFTDRQLVIAAVSAVASILISYLASLLLQGMLVVAVSDAVIGRKPSPSQVWDVIRPRLAALLGASLLVALFTGAAVMVWLAVLWVLILAGVVGLTVAWIFLGGIAVLITTLWLTVRLMFVTQTLVLERQPVWTAVRRSWGLTRRTFWRLLGIFLLTTILVSFITSALSTVLIIPSALIPAAQGVIAVIVLNAAAAYIASLLSVPFTAAVTCLLYIDTRMRLEGLDIQLARVS